MQAEEKKEKLGQLKDDNVHLQNNMNDNFQDKLQENFLYNGKKYYENIADFLLLTAKLQENREKLNI